MTRVNVHVQTHLNCAGDSQEEEISCLAVDRRYVFTGCGCSVLCYKLGKQV